MCAMLEKGPSAAMLVVAVFLAILVFAGPPAIAGTLPDGVTQNLVLAPGVGNPRNSEGDFVNLKDGRVLFVYSHFTGGNHNDSACDLCSRASSDGGKTWTGRDEPSIEAKAHSVANVMSVSLLRLADGRIALFYLVKKSDADARLVMRTSRDEASTWSEPTGRGTSSSPTAGRCS
jgi:sialidase-1